jgi:tetratricopeptide (TPR) repeat protein
VKSKELFEIFLKASPKNIRAIRTLGTISLLSKDNDKAVDYYKQAIMLGDERSVVFLGSAYIMAQKPDGIKSYLEPLKQQAKENLEAFNVLMLYAMRDRENPDKDLMKSAISGMDARKIILSATPDGFSTVIRFYLASRDLWTPSALVVPARAAALMETWLLARDCYRKALAADPNDKLALRGMGLVEYRTGDVLSAAHYIKSAYDKGEKDAATDGIELFLLSNRTDVWDMFKPMVKDATLSPQIRAGLVQYAANNGGQPDMFYTAAVGPEAELLYKDANVLALLKTGVEKYASDKRSAEVVKLIQAAEKNGKK